MQNRSPDDHISSVDASVVNTSTVSFHEDSAELEVPAMTASESGRTPVATRTAETSAAQSTAPKMPELAADCLDSRMQLTNELDRMYQVCKTSRSLPLSNRPYAGDIHKQRQALSRALVERLRNCTKPDTFKLELVNTAIEHEIFDNRTMRTAKNLLTSVVRTFWSSDNPTPVMPARSQVSLLAYRDELLDKMKAEVVPSPSQRLV